MHTPVKWTIIPLAAVMLASCNQQSGKVSGQDLGTAAGAVAGGVAGYQFGGGVGQALTTVGGALLGGALGNVVGKSWDEKDVTAYDEASQKAMESGIAQSWKNSASGYYGTITPSAHYTNFNGQPCRQYSQVIYMHGHQHVDNGTACKQPDGIWRPVNT